MIRDFNLEKKTTSLPRIFLNNEKSLPLFFSVISLATDYWTVMVTFYPYCDIALFNCTLGPGIANAGMKAKGPLVLKQDLTFLQQKKLQHVFLLITTLIIFTFGVNI